MQLQQAIEQAQTLARQGQQAMAVIREGAHYVPVSYAYCDEVNVEPVTVITDKGKVIQ